jgi:hypothetical protein
MLSRLKPDAECGALRKWLRQYHLGIDGEMLTRRVNLTLHSILVDVWRHKLRMFHRMAGTAMNKGIEG